MHARASSRLTAHLVPTADLIDAVCHMMWPDKDHGMYPGMLHCAAGRVLASSMKEF